MLTTGPGQGSAGDPEPPPVRKELSRMNIRVCTRV
jgi:hypothetical protein